MFSVKFLSLVLSVLTLVQRGFACEVCDGPQKDVVLTRNVRRMQPDAENATTGPRGPLAWGQLNVLHTTDTHGWLEGHVKEQNYGADWGDWVSFVANMRQKAKQLGVDLLLVDTGDLHDGAGLSDNTSPNGLLSNPIFENVDYDILTIGNHELYVTDIAYETFNQFAKIYGDKYLTSNVQILNPSTNQFEYVGSQYRYFTTANGLRIMSFGVLYDFTGNSNVSRVIKAADMVKQQWFLDAVNYEKPIDLFLLIGHNPVRNGSTFTFQTVASTIRSMRPEVPLQGFGGHTHIRDFAVFDNMSTALESGRYCETLGWFSMTGISSSTYNGTNIPQGVPNPIQPAVNVSANPGYISAHSSSSLLYSRRYLDWNRRTFAYHANGSQDMTFDTQQGQVITDDITATRQALNLTTLFGCAPQTWCMTCKPFGDSGNIYTGLLADVLGTVVVNETRADQARYIIINTGNIRFDLVKGPFTLDDSYIVSPFTNTFQFIPDVPYDAASQILAILNAGPYQKKKRDLSTSDFSFQPLTDLDHAHGISCLDRPTPFELQSSMPHLHSSRSTHSSGPHRILRRRSTDSVPGYTTSDDFGTDGDDIIHSSIPSYPLPIDLQANVSFPTNGSNPATVDVVFLNFIVDYVLDALAQAGANYAESDVGLYMPEDFTSNDMLKMYAMQKWQANVPNCPVGEGVGFD